MIEFLRKFENSGIKISRFNSIFITKSTNLQFFTLILYGVVVRCDRRRFSVLRPFIEKSMVEGIRLFKYINGVVREVNVRVLGKRLELLSANGGRFEINQLLFADDTALVADSEDKLCRLVSEFGRVWAKKKVESECR